MKRIGYIYKYNPSEGLGILVYGKWKVESGWGWRSSTIIKNTPILFSVNEYYGNKHQEFYNFRDIY